MIKVQDWVASIPEEEKHVAYMGEGKSETRQFLLCGDGWQTYRQWGFHLDMAFDPQSITAHQQRQVEETRVNTTKNTDETGVNTQEVTTKESYTTDDKTVAWDDLTDIAALSKTVTEEGILLTWQVLYQHTRLPGRLWANLRAVGPDTQQVKKSALMVFEVDPSVDATPSDIPTMNEFEQMEARMSQLCEQAYTSADTAVSAASGAVQSQQQAASAAAAAAQSATAAASHHQHVEELKQAATNTYNNAVHYAQVASEQATAAETAQQQVATMKDVIVKIQNNAKHHAEVAAEKAIEAEEYYESTAALKQMAININENTKHHAQIATTKADEAAADAATVAESRQAIQKAVGLCSQYTQRCEAVMYNLEADQRAAALHCINVKDYGAKGEGGDDQQSISNALQAAVENIRNGRACEVYFPAGVYGITKGGFTIQLPYGSGGLTIRGAGRDLTTIKYLPEWTNSSWYAIRIQPEGCPSVTPTSEEQWLHDISITGLTVYDTDPESHAIHPDKGDSGKEETHGFDIQFCKRAAVTDCNILYVGDEAIDIYSCHDVLVSGNHIEGSPGAGTAGGAISIGDGSKNVVVSGNTVNATAPNETLDNGTVLDKRNFGIAVESLSIPVDNVTITGNTVTAVRGNGINLAATQEGASITNVCIGDNVIAGCYNGIKMSGAYPKKGIQISNNTITDCVGENESDGYALYTGPATYEVLFVSNIVRNTAGNSAVSLTVASSGQIANCLFSDIGKGALYLVGAVTVRDCTFRNVGFLSAEGNALGCDTGANTLVTVSHCIFKEIRQATALSGVEAVEHTEIAFVEKGKAITSTKLSRVIGGRFNGYFALNKDGAVVQGLTIHADTIATHAITIAANGVSVTGCNIYCGSKYKAIIENDGYRGNLVANNIVNGTLSTGAVLVLADNEGSVCVNNIDLRTLSA